jgi:uncharacterized protein
MLYDNAQLSLVYLHAYLITGEDEFRRICEATLDFVLREMTHPEGGFYSSLDADSEGEEGTFYVWTPEQIQAAIGDPQDATLLMASYGVTQTGNFEGSNVLQRVLDDEQIAEAFEIPEEAIPEKFANLHTQLLEARSGRVRPGTDDKILTSWNALMMISFAEAGRYLRRDDYTAVAKRNAEFLLNALYPNNRLLRSWREGEAKHNAYLEDYAALILGLLALYQSDPAPRWFEQARNLTGEMNAHFHDPEGGFFDTRDDHETLLYRPKDVQDNAFPSGNALAANALLQMSAYELDLEGRESAEKMIGQMVDALSRYPTGFGQWLCAADYALGPVKEVAILGNPKEPQTQVLVDSLWEQYRPRLAAAISNFPIASQGPKLLEERVLLNDQPSAYVCQNFVCQRPVNRHQDLLAQI